MPDEFDIAQERVEADTERAVANRVRFGGESAHECRECGEGIPQARREALPGVQQCVSCADIAERQA